MLSFGHKASLLPVLLIVVFSAQAQDPDSCQKRSVVVNVRDQESRLVSGLQPASFRGSLRGQPVRVLSDEVNTEPPRIVLLIDLSGSVNRSNHKLQTTQFLSENFVATSFVPRVALVLFSDRTPDVVGFEHGPKEILQKLANLNDGWGRTALFDSLMYAAGLFQTHEPGDAIYAITDGADNQSKFREKDVQQELLSKGIRLFSFVVSTAQPPLITEIERQNGYLDVQRLAEVTGGSIVNAEYNPYENEHRELEASLQRAYDKMKSFYKLDVQLPVKLDKEHPWELQAMDEHGKRRKDVEITYARNLVSCR
jgi:von Willebrand factor type A domain